MILILIIRSKRGNCLDILIKVLRKKRNQNQINSWLKRI